MHNNVLTHFAFKTRKCNAFYHTIKNSRTVTCLYMYTWSGDVWCQSEQRSPISQEDQYPHDSSIQIRILIQMCQQWQWS